MTNYPPGAERALEEQAAETEAYNAWERMAESSDALDKLTGVMASAAWAASHWPDGREGRAVGGGPSFVDIERVIWLWLNQHADLYDWFVARGLIPSFEDWRKAQTERDGGEEQDRKGDEERDARIADGRIR